MMEYRKSEKSALTTLFLCMFLGCLGIHRFYVGKVWTGILMFITAGGLGIWMVIDLITIAVGAFKDESGATLEFNFAKDSRGKQIALVLALIFGFYFVLAFAFISLIMYATGGVVDIVREQLAAIKAGNISKAYSYTSSEFQRSTSESEFAQYVEQYEAIKNNTDSTFMNRSVDSSTDAGSTGSVKGYVTGPQGETTNVEYTLVKENGHWKILNIKVNPDKAVDKAADKTAATDEAATEAATDANGEPDSAAATTDIKLPNVFTSKENQYSIHYPANWEYSKPDKATVVIGGKEGSPDYDSTVNIQTVLTKKAGGKYSNVKEFLDSLKAQALEQSDDTKIISEEPITIDETENSIGMEGRYMVFTYTYHGVKFKQMQFVFERGDQEAFYAWAYTSPQARYEEDYPIAKAMFSTWAVH